MTRPSQPEPVTEAGATPGPVTEAYATGAVRSRGSLLDGQMHGEWVFFRKDGSVMRTGSFDRGVQTGAWRTFDRSGRLVKETHFLERG